MQAISLDLQVGATPVACTIYEPGLAWPQRSPSSANEHVDRGRQPLAAALAGRRDAWRGNGRSDRLRSRTTAHPNGSGRSCRPWRVPGRRPGWSARWYMRPWLPGAFPTEMWQLEQAQTGGSRDWATARARSFGLTDARQLGDAVRRSRALLQRFRAADLYAEMEAAERRLHEVPYSLEVEGGVDNGILDAIFVRDGAWTVVEFKTDDVRDEAGLEQAVVQRGLCRAEAALPGCGRALVGPAASVFAVPVELFGAGAGGNTETLSH